MSESLVDLLLVRLGREEEKRKVLKLLITSLDLSVSDAENAVNNSPSVIREAVPMGEARAIQKDLYPYIDLLPRLDSEEAAEEPPVEPPGEDYDIPEDPPEEEESSEEEDEDEEEYDDYDDQTDSPEESILITSASDEIRATNRCHICGRTPTDGEKLAPCRTCSELTCRECFDRIAHVCSKCAASGKSIEHANEGVMPEKEEGLVFDSDGEQTPEETSRRGPLRYVLTGLVFIAALAAVFYFMDPMGLFSGTPVTVSAPSDTLEAVTAAEDTLTADTAFTPETPDTLQVQETPADPQEDPFALGNLTLAGDYTGIQDPPPVFFHGSAPRETGAEVLRTHSGILEEHLSIIAAASSVELSSAAMLVFHDSTCVLVMAINHPEEMENRLDLLRRTAQWLAPTRVGQLVLYYRENRFQETLLMSLAAPSFQDVQGVLSPGQFQNYLGYREDCWEFISGPVSQWLTDIQ